MTGERNLRSPGVVGGWLWRASAAAADGRAPESAETDSNNTGIPEGHEKHLNTVSPKPVSPDHEISDVEKLEQDIIKEGHILHVIYSTSTLKKDYFNEFIDKLIDTLTPFDSKDNTF